jgi:calcineurin-like phosphoesterase family protein
MDETLIVNWNKRVHSGDNVYILGDLIFRASKSPDSYLARLKGKKHLILGNHDKDWVKKADLERYFESVASLTEMSAVQKRVTLCHYPMMSWNHMAKGAYMIHGHIHNNRNADYFPLMRKMSNLLNAGVDINDFRPVKLCELIANNENFKSERTEQELVADAVSGFAGIAERLNELTDISLSECTPIAESIIAGHITSSREIERQLDRLLDFGYDERAAELFERILRSLEKKDTELVQDYREIYRDMWVNPIIDENDE